MDGDFSDLNPDVLTVEVDDYTKEVYKLLKVFTNRYKKQQVQRDERERERKANVKRRSTIVDARDAKLIALQKAEEELHPPAAINVCEKVIDQLNDFKVISNFPRAYVMTAT